MDYGDRLPVIRAFMDDLTITSSSHVQARWFLTKLDEVATWARMTFKQRMSRSMIMIKKTRIICSFKVKSFNPW